MNYTEFERWAEMGKDGADRFERRVNHEWPTGTVPYAWRRFGDLPLEQQLQLAYLKGQLDGWRR